jgi:hypothetical protein
MISLETLFVIYTEAGEIRLMGNTASIEFLQANVYEGDYVHWGDAVAKAAHGIVEEEDIELNIV